MLTCAVNCHIRVSVADRLRLRNNDYIPPMFIELAMGWLQGDLTNELWKKITFIPFQVVQYAYKMQDLLSAFVLLLRNKMKQSRNKMKKQLQQRRQHQTNIPMSNLMIRKVKVIFKPRFMTFWTMKYLWNMLEIVFGFIIAHGDMFVKPYILQLYCETNNSWSC